MQSEICCLHYFARYELLKKSLERVQSCFHFFNRSLCKFSLWIAGPFSRIALQIMTGFDFFPNIHHTYIPENEIHPPLKMNTIYIHAEFLFLSLSLSLSLPCIYLFYSYNILRCMFSALKDSRTESWLWNRKKNSIMLWIEFSKYGIVFSCCSGSFRRVPRTICMTML